MTVPSRVDAAALLLSLDPPAWFLRHSPAVAELAARGDPAATLPHGDGSADWLTRRGHAELARAVAAHPVTRLLDGERYRRWAAFASREERVVAYADKRAGQRLESMADRFASWDRRYPGAWSEEQRRAVGTRAARLEADVCRAAGVRPDEVRRLPWTGRALRRAAAPSA